MKIECDKCGAKYSIADEKVRGKTFKIRCKKCSNVIIVRDKIAAAVGADTGAADLGSQQIGWHLAIDGETIGPMSEDDVRQRYDAGEIDKDTAIWQEGFDDWARLGDVDTFGDLPNPQPAADPFTSANQEDYAAGGLGSGLGGGMGGGASLGGGAALSGGGGLFAANELEDAHAAPVARSAGFTGQRNENSVLFSLDSLQSLAKEPAPSMSSSMPMAQARRRDPGTRGLALAAPGSEGSGLIDIRALGAMVGTQSTTAARSDGTNSGATDGAPLPSFAGSSLGLAATPLAPNPTMMDPAALAAAATPRSNPLLYLVVGALVVAVVALGYMLFMRDQQRELEAKNSASMAPSVIAAAKDDEADEDESEDKKKDKDDEDALEVDEFEEIEEADPVTGKKVKRRVKKTTQRRKPSDSDPLKDAAKDPAPKAPTKTASKGEDVSVGCILDPDSCKDKASGSSKPKTAAVDPNLPPSLTAAEFKKGLQSVKSQAKSCGSRHGAKGGDSVQIRLSISGSTGNVTSAAATGPHKGTALGNCVAAAIKSAKFSKFQKSSQGFSFGVRM